MHRTGSSARGDYALLVRGAGVQLDTRCLTQQTAPLRINNPKKAFRSRLKYGAIQPYGEKQAGQVPLCYETGTKRDLGENKGV